MTIKKRAAIAGIICVSLVIAARATISLGDILGYPGALILFPGSIPNLLFFGVHRDWGLMGEITMLTISAAVWFAVSFSLLLLAGRFLERKK